MVSGYRDLIFHIDTILLLLLLVLSITMIFIDDLLSVIIFNSVFSILVALTYIVMKAPDVSMTEASLGACVTTIFSIIFYEKLSTKSKYCENDHSYVLLASLVALSVFFYHITFALPQYGSAQNIVNLNLLPDYIENTYEIINISSITTAILADFRAFDTLGETFVIFVGTVVCIFIFHSQANEDNILCFDDMLFTTIFKITAPILLIFVSYLHFFAESSPGGAFQASSVLVSFFIIHNLIKSKLKFNIKMLNHLIFTATIGLMIYIGVGIIPMLGGRNFLNFSLLNDNVNNAHGIGIMIAETGIFAVIFSSIMIMFILLQRESDANNISN